MVKTMPQNYYGVPFHNDHDNDDDVKVYFDNRQLTGESLDYIVIQK